MYKTRFSESQIIKALKENEVGRSVEQISRELWIMDFMSDCLGDGITFRILNVIDNYKRMFVKSREYTFSIITCSIAVRRNDRILQKVKVYTNR